jgi:hypothetical protein
MTYNAYDIAANGHLSTKKLDTPGGDLMRPHSEAEPTREQRPTDLTQDAVVESPDEKVLLPGLVRLISEQCVSDEKLGWLKPTIVGGNVSYVPADEKDLYGGRGKIVDAEGVVYDGILCEGGTVDEGWFEYDSPQTFEYFSRYKDEYNSQPDDASREPSFVDLAETCLGNMHYFLRQEKQTGHIFLYSYHRQCSPSDFIAAVETVQQLASWLFALHEQQTVIFPQTGHFVVNLPEELRRQIERLAPLKDRSVRDWIVECLSECAGYKPPLASPTKVQQPQYTPSELAELQAQIEEIVKSVKSRQSRLEDEQDQAQTASLT